MKPFIETAMKENNKKLTSGPEKANGTFSGASLLFCLVIVSVALGVFASYKPASFAHRVVADFFKGTHAARQGPRAIAAAIGKLPGQGDLFFRVEGFDLCGSGRHESIVSFIYFRTTYLLYPRRVYAARPETPVNRSCDIAHANFTPDAGWLKSHNISAVLTCRSDPGGRIRFDIDTLWDAPQPQRPQPGFSMAVTWSLLSFFLIVLTGVGTVILIDRNKSLSLPDVLGTGVAIGAGLLASFLFSASLAGAPPSRILFAGWAFVWGGLVWFAWMKRQSTPRLLLQAPGTRISVAWWAVITTMVAGSSIVVAAIHAFGTALIEWDAFSIWCLKAKVLAATALQDDPSYFYNPAMSYSHLDYPLLVPFLVSGTYGMTGYVQEHLGRMIFPILFIATAFFMYRALQWSNNRRQAAWLTALMTGLPLSIRWAGAGTADSVLVLYYAGSIHYTVKWLVEEKRADWMMAILFTGFCAFTKNEGMALAAINLLVAFSFSLPRWSKRRVAELAFYLFGAGVQSTAWLIWSRNMVRSHENYLSRLNAENILANTDRLGSILRAIAGQSVQWQQWGGLWGLLALAAILGYRAFGQRRVMAMWTLLGMHLALYVLIYLITPWDLSDHLSCSLDRLLLHCTPAVVFLIGYHWQKPDHIRKRADSFT